MSKNCLKTDFPFFHGMHILTHRHLSNTNVGSCLSAVVTVLPFIPPACWVCYLWQPFWSWSCQKCTECKDHLLVFWCICCRLNFPFVFWFLFKYVEIFVFKPQENSDWENKLFSLPKFLKANPFCLLQFNGRAIFGKRPESRSLTVVYSDLDTHPFLVWYSSLFCISLLYCDTCSIATCVELFGHVFGSVTSYFVTQ